MCKYQQNWRIYLFLKKYFIVSLILMEKELVAQHFPLATKAKMSVCTQTGNCHKVREKSSVFSICKCIFITFNFSTFWLQAGPQRFLCLCRTKKSFCCMHISSFRVLQSNFAGRGNKWKALIHTSSSHSLSLLWFSSQVNEWGSDDSLPVVPLRRCVTFTLL